MSETSQREWRFYIADMITSGEKILSYTDGLDQSAFVSDNLRYDATLRNLALMGEAAAHIPIQIRDNYPDIPWRMVIATRNRLIHAYLSIDDDITWSIIRDDLRPLLGALKQVRDTKE